MSASPHARRGFALVAVLWVLVAVGTIGTALSLSARGAVLGSQNRVDLMRAAWLAEGCAAAVHAEVDDLLDDVDSTSMRWHRLDSAVLQRSRARCEWRLVPSGLRLDINAAPEEVLHRLFQLSVGDTRADSLLDAALDWIDEDDDPRSRGAERASYALSGLLTPRNGPIAGSAEVRLVRGFDAEDSLLELLGAEPERLFLDRAPLPLLRALPAIDDEMAAAIESWRRIDGGPLDLMRLAAQVSPASRDTLLANYAALAMLVTTEPEAWYLHTVGRSGSRAITSTLVLQLRLNERRATITRRQSWP